jgi:hypothetical protein
MRVSFAHAAAAPPLLPGQDMGEALLGGLMSMAAAIAADTNGELLSPKALRVSGWVGGGLDG